ncbi:hypothetical protein [Dietzia sp. 179-F 9C3 NHS]|uniref:hypothetical protein n=1 Tax=Dietzia sp. 179-F 9C3 NHS TaxID=3374295 RepID=UPI00387999FD
MAEDRPTSGADVPPEREVAPAPSVHSLASELLAAADVAAPDLRGGTVLAMAEASDPVAPPRVEAAGGGCGGGRRILLDGAATTLTDGDRPTHLLVRAVGPDGSGVLVLVERGERGVEPWPRGGERTGEVVFRAVRLDADRVVTGEVRDPA